MLIGVDGDCFLSINIPCDSLLSFYQINHTYDIMHVACLNILWLCSIFFLFQIEDIYQKINVTLKRIKINLGWAHDQASKNLTRDVRAEIHRCQFVYLFPYICSKPSNFHITSSFPTLPVVTWNQRVICDLLAWIFLWLNRLLCLVLLITNCYTNLPLETDWKDTKGKSFSPYPIDRATFLKEWNFFSGT